MTTQNPTRKLFFGLFVFPLLIAVGMAVLLCAVVLLTHEAQTPESLVSSIKTGAAGKRAQKAYELSNELNRLQGRADDPTLLNEIIFILKSPERYDPMTRRYMTLALSHFKSPDAVNALRNALKDNDDDVRLYAVWSLGVAADSTAAADIAPFLASDSAEMRKISAYVLGALGASQYKSQIEALLRDETQDVRWNAALALARLGSNAGTDVLIRMLDRDTYKGSPMREEDIEKTMINAAKGLALIKSNSALAALQPISQSERSLKVRQAAMDAMKFIRGEAWAVK